MSSLLGIYIIIASALLFGGILGFAISYEGDPAQRNRSDEEGMRMTARIAFLSPVWPIMLVWICLRFIPVMLRAAGWMREKVDHDVA